MPPPDRRLHAPDLTGARPRLGLDVHLDLPGGERAPRARRSWPGRDRTAGRASAGSTAERRGRCPCWSSAHLLPLTDGRAGGDVEAHPAPGYPFWVVGPPGGRRGAAPHIRATAQNQPTLEKPPRHMRADHMLSRHIRADQSPSRHMRADQSLEAVVASLVYVHAAAGQLFLLAPVSFQPLLVRVTWRHSPSCQFFLSRECLAHSAAFQACPKTSTSPTGETSPVAGSSTTTRKLPREAWSEPRPVPHGAASTISFGTVFRALRRSVVPEPSMSAETLFRPLADPMRTCLTWSGVRSGLAWSSSAASPLTTAAAIEVPEARAKRAPTPACGFRVSAMPPGTRRPSTETPGAVTSTCRSSVPSVDHEGTVSSAKVTVPAESIAPTARTCGSDAGLARFRVVSPSLPPAATTTMPFRQAFSTAKASGSTWLSWIESVP